MSHCFSGIRVHSFEPVLRALQHYVGNPTVGDQPGRTLQDDGFKAVHVNLKEIDLFDVKLLGHSVKSFGANHGSVWIVVGDHSS